VMSREEIGRDELLRVRVARGDFGVRPASGPEDRTASAAG